MESIYNFTLAELKKKLIRKGFSSYSARQVFAWVYKKRIRSFSGMSDIPAGRRKILKKLFYFPRLEASKQEVSRDGTNKFLFRLKDKEAIEAVLIPDKKRNTLCISSQAGCRFNCKFCASKEGGFIRNLTPSEIVSQYLAAGEKEKITNIVLMGIGEPLDNFENTVKSVKILTEPAGINFTKRRISLSTCGLADKIKKLAGLNLGIKLSISLHAASDKKRSKIMPVNETYPLDHLVRAVGYYNRRRRYPVTFEYILIGGFNTQGPDAAALVKLVNKTGAKLNLIPYNAAGKKLKTPAVYEVKDFLQKLKEKKLVFTLRKARGSDINAACGQLRSRAQEGYE